MEPVRTIINKFVEGVNTDIAEDVIKNTLLTGGHNIKLTNDDNRQGVVNKQESYIKELDGYGANLKPLAAKVYDNVIYIVSYDMTQNLIEYGTYPSADLTALPVPDIDDKTSWVRPKVNKYAPLPNYKLEPKVFANPSTVTNIDYAGDTILITLTTNEGQWELVGYSGIAAPTPAFGNSGTDITVIIPANNTQETKFYSISLKVKDDPTHVPDPIDGIVVTTVVFSQIANINAVGHFNVDTINNTTGSSIIVTVTYSSGTGSTGWIISKQVGSGNATATFTPSTDTESGDTTVVLTGAVNDTAIYELIDVATSTVLDTITITIIDALPIVILHYAAEGTPTMIETDSEVTFTAGLTGNHGICWVLGDGDVESTLLPTIDDDVQLINTTGEREFAFIEGLTTDNWYNVRAYYDYPGPGVSYSSMVVVKLGNPI
jgi:hypothetical protein